MVDKVEIARAVKGRPLQKTVRRGTAPVLLGPVRGLSGATQGGGQLGAVLLKTVRTVLYLLYLRSLLSKYLYLLTS